MNGMTNGAVAGQPLRFGRRLTRALARQCGDALIASYLHGSSVLGGWTEHRSDVDMLLIVAADGAGTMADGLGRSLVALSPGCPGRGLEVSVVTTAQAAAPMSPYGYLLHYGDGRLVDGRGQAAGDDDLLMHYAVCRAAGYPLLGPPPPSLIAPSDRRAVLNYLAAELDWGLANAPESYAVLNACRAAEYLETGQIVSKVAGGSAALRRNLGPPELIRRALDQQRGLIGERPSGPDAVAFVAGIRDRLRS